MNMEKKEKQMKNLINSLRAIGETGIALQYWNDFLTIIDGLDVDLSKGAIKLQNSINEKILFLEKTEYKDHEIFKYIDASKKLEFVIIHVKNARKLTHSGFGDDFFYNFLNNPVSDKKGIERMTEQLMASISCQTKDINCLI